MGKLVSAALIVRNEEHHIGACLQSITGLVDEIIVADTGSRDRSREIAAACGARLVQWPPCPPSPPLPPWPWPSPWPPWP